MRWFEAAFYGWCPYLPSRGSANSVYTGRTSKAAKALFGMVSDIDRKGKLSWAETKSVLENARMALAALDPAWDLAGDDGLS